MKQTTKSCPECGNTHLGLLRSQNLKLCNNYKQHSDKKIKYIPWPLDEGQKPLV